MKTAMLSMAILLTAPLAAQARTVPYPLGPTTPSKIASVVKQSLTNDAKASPHGQIAPGGGLLFLAQQRNGDGGLRRPGTFQDGPARFAHALFRDASHGNRMTLRVYRLNQRGAAVVDRTIRETETPDLFEVKPRHGKTRLVRVPRGTGNLQLLEISLDRGRGARLRAHTYLNTFLGDLAR